MFFFFFFQAEDGIRDLTVTGVQTCALPISERERLFGRAVSRSLACVVFPATIASRKDLRRAWLRAAMRESTVLRRGWAGRIRRLMRRGKRGIFPRKFPRWMKF